MALHENLDGHIRQAAVSYHLAVWQMSFAGMTVMRPSRRAVSLRPVLRACGAHLVLVAYRHQIIWALAIHLGTQPARCTCHSDGIMYHVSYMILNTLRL